MKNHVVAALLAACAITVAACGSDSGSGGSGGGYGSGSSGSAPKPPPKAGKDGLTPPGTQLSLAEAADVGWVPTSTYSATGARKAIPLQVSVGAIEKGMPADLEKVSLDDDQRDATPYYVKVRVTNRGTTAPATDDPDITFQAIDDRGQRQPSLTFIGGQFRRCDNTQPPRPFERGKTYDSCLTFLMKGGGSISEVRWADGPSTKDAVSAYFDKPIVWGAATPPPPGKPQP